MTSYQYNEIRTFKTFRYGLQYNLYLIGAENHPKEDVALTYIIDKFALGEMNEVAPSLVLLERETK